MFAISGIGRSSCRNIAVNVINKVQSSSRRTFVRSLSFLPATLSKVFNKSAEESVQNETLPPPSFHPTRAAPTNGNFEPNFGLFFDIDGVIVRGRKLLPYARDAFRMLTDKNGKFEVPTVFVTNAGNCLRQTKADQLSEWLDVEVDAEQVIMSHSPLKMFQQYLNKHVLVSGQGPVEEIAKYLGFTKVTNMEDMRHAFPTLDKVDHQRRITAPCAFEQHFPRIEAVILFGEPVRWETNLQLLMDVLVTNGKPCTAPAEVPYPHIPILACNMDLMWMCEAPMPRFGHGCFLHCMESLYKKITGKDLRYTALVGKPSEITYYHSEHVLQEQARAMGLPGITRMYCVGDNPDVDIYGANLFNRSLQKKLDTLRTKLQKQRMKELEASSDDKQDRPSYLPEHFVPLNNGGSDLNGHHIGAQKCESILVCTGVYNATRDYTNSQASGSHQQVLLHHNHRDFIMDQNLRKPAVIVHNVLESVHAVFEKEGLSSRLENREELS